MVRNEARRLATIAGLAAGAAALASLLLVLDGVLRLTRFWPPPRIDAAILVGLVALLGLARKGAGWDRLDPDVRDGLRRGIARLDDVSDWILKGNRPTIAAIVLIAWFFVAWAPHYLTWPFWTDQDAIATLAIGWERGRLPWRDQISFQFPGEIELFWVVGRLFGWGSSVAFYSADLAMLGLLLAAVSASSRACLGRWLPGLMASLFILGYYAPLPFTQVAQRDWHAAELAAISLLLMLAGRAWWLILLSSLAYALALTIRPHTVVFLPAIGLAFLRPPRGGAGSWKPAATWLAGLIVCLAATFSPVVLSGLAGDFLRAFRFATRSGGPYAGASLARSWRILGWELDDSWTIFIAAMLMATALAGTSWGARRLASVMLAAMAGAILYRPLHPVDHAYLNQPLELFRALAIPSIVDGLHAPRFAPAARLASLAFLVVLAMPWPDSNCDPRESVAAISALWNRTAPSRPPPGASLAYLRDEPGRYPYQWKDYLATLDYLRFNTDPTTPVANLLTYSPYPSLNGAVGRATPMPIEAMSLIAWFPDVDFDAMIAPALEGAADAVVVRDAVPPEGHLGARLRRTREVLDRSYRVVARHGGFEIRRKGASVADQKP